MMTPEDDDEFCDYAAVQVLAALVVADAGQRGRSNDPAHFAATAYDFAEALTKERVRRREAREEAERKRPR